MILEQQQQEEEEGNKHSAFPREVQTYLKQIRRGEGLKIFKCLPLFWDFR